VAGSIAGNSGSGNGYDGISVITRVTRHVEWSDPTGSFPIVVNGRLEVWQDASLTVSEGTVIKSARCVWFVGGALHVIGSPARPVVMTSVRDDAYAGDTNADDNSTIASPGDWHGIWLTGTSGGLGGVGEFEHAILRFGGDPARFVAANVAFSEADSGRFINSISELSGSAGIRVIGSSPVIRGSIIRSNDGFGVEITDSGLPDLGAFDPLDRGHNTFLSNDNGQFQVVNDTPNAIPAYGNRWGFQTAAEIDSHILDDDEDPARGPVLFDPWDAAGAPGIPALSIAGLFCLIIGFAFGGLALLGRSRE
jgi:hypothetical protein